MKTQKIHEDFKGYGSYPLAESEKLIRDRILECMGGLHEKNEQCLIKAGAEGREKLVSEFETLKKRLEKMKSSMQSAGSGGRYKFEKLSAANEKRLQEIDSQLEELFSKCSDMFDGLSCSEPDLHIIERYSEINDRLGQIDRLFHERMKIFRMMYVFG